MLVLALALALVAAACADGDDDPGAGTSSDGGAASPPAGDVAWPEGLDPGDAVEPVACWASVPEDEGVACAEVAVPADHGAPDDGELRLAVAVLPPVGEVTSPPVVYLEGGPGYGAVPTIDDWISGTLAPLRQGRVVVLPDQRGTGYSMPSLACPEVEDGDDVADALGACRDRLEAEGVDLADYTSAANAADIAELRTALGIDAWDLMGSSYGTRLALTVVRDVPAGVRAVALDGLFPPEADGAGAEGTRESVVYALDALVERCRQDPVCAADVPDLAGDLVAAVRWLEERYEAGGDVDGTVLLNAVIDLLPWPDLPWLVADLAARDEAALAELEELVAETGYRRPHRPSRVAGGDEEPSAAEGEAHAMAWAITCTEEEAFAEPAAGSVPGWPDDVVALIDVMGEPDPACDVLDLDPAPPVEDEPVRSDLPTLVVNGVLDAVTPPAWAQRAADALTDVTVVLVPERGHGAVADPCVVGIVAQFLDDPGAELDTSCVDDLEPSYDAG